MKETVRIPAAERPIEEGDPAADARAFRRCLGQYATGVAVMTVQHGDTPVGMAVNSFAAVSLEPPLVLWSIRRESGSVRAFLEGRYFAVNVLSSQQVETSQLFGAPHPDRFAQVAWSAGRQGAPLLAGAIAHLECRLETVHEGGDHLIVVGRVEHHARFEGAPLLFAQGQYAVSQNHPRLAAPTASPTGASAGEADAADELFMTRLKAASQQMSASFEEHRQALGLTLASGRILNSLSAGPCGIEAIERATYLGHAAMEDALSELLGSGLVLTDGGGCFGLTPQGREKREALTRRAQAFTAQKLHGLPEADIASARRVLLALQA